MVLFLSQQFAKEITHETGVESSLEGGDIKEYVKEVLREVHPCKGLNLIAIN
jgi:hypothetical protein